MVRFPNPARVFLCCLTLASGAFAHPLDSAIGMADVDAANAKVSRGADAEPVDPKLLLRTLGVLRDVAVEPLQIKQGKEAEGKPVRLIIPFKKPVKLGSVFWRGSFSRIHFVKEGGVPVWTECTVLSRQAGATLATLPPQTTASAVMLEVAEARDTAELSAIRFFADRLGNVTPVGQAYADAEYTEYFMFSPPVTHSADRVTKGIGSWINTGKTKQGTIPRAPVSNVDPSWFMLTWRQPQAIVGMWTADNFTTVDLQYFDGPKDISARAGTGPEWRKVRRPEVAKLAGRLVSFDPQLTRGVRMSIQATSAGPVAKVDGAFTFVSLADDQSPPVSVPPTQLLPPASIAYQAPMDGTGTMVIDGPDGTRVRNLFAREPAKAGPRSATWDLKDDNGQFVPVGTYTWRTIAAPPLQLKYVTTVYPNVLMNHPENAPWITGMEGSGGWMADHTGPRGGATAGDLVFFSSPVSESGVSFHASDLTGKKLWAIGSFGAFIGANELTADASHAYALGRLRDGADAIWKIDTAKHSHTTLATLAATTNRARRLAGVANVGDSLYLSVNAQENWLGTAATAVDVDVDACIPKYGPKRAERRPFEQVPDPRGDFMGLFRLGGEIPGFQNASTITRLESTAGKSARRHIVLAFKKPVPIGSAVFPGSTDPELKIKLAALKPDLPLPANPGDNAQWIPFETEGGDGFDVATAPKNLMTRAIRVSVLRGEDDALTQADEKSEYDSSLSIKSEGLSLDGDKATGLEATTWKGTVDGMKLMSRRFENVAGRAKVLADPGKVERDRAWTADRKTPLSEGDPARYALAWEEPQELRGLAIKEVDARRAEVDVWTGAGPVNLTEESGWKHVRTYQQARRNRRAMEANEHAQYLDGYVDLGAGVKTKGVRLRLVEQWLGDGIDEAARWDVPRGKEIDVTRARVLGIAALRYVGGEPTAGADPLEFNRIEQVSKETGKITGEVGIAKPGALAAAADGNVFALSDNQIVKVDLKGGQHQRLTSDLVKPAALAIDSKGSLYTFESKTNVVRVYGTDGKFQREVGKPGGYQAGPWDPYRLQEVSSLVIDRKDQLWIVSECYWPKRIALFSALDGKWQRDFLGNTNYGGAGALDPADKRRLFVNRLEFEIDWETGKSQLKNLTWAGETPPGDNLLYVNGKQYMVNFNDVGGTAGVGVVYSYEKDRLRLLAAVGKASGFSPLRSDEIQKSLNGTLMTTLIFNWTDLNGDQKVGPDEVQFSPTPAGYRTISRFDHSLGMAAGTVQFDVEKFLPSGAPVYKIRPTPGIKAGGGISMFKTDDGKGYYVQGGNSPSGVIRDDGTWNWRYDTEGASTHGYAAAKPYWPGQMVGQFFVNGHFTAHAGDLGEAFSLHNNMGSMDVVTADGMVATSVFHDQRLPKLRSWTFPQHERGMDMSDMTLGQEHFGGYLTRTSDNHYYAVVGHNHVSVVEVLGLDKFKRQEGKLEVTPELLNRTLDWERTHQREENDVRVPVVDVYKAVKPPKIDGRLDDWDAPSATIGNPTEGEGRNATLRVRFDDQRLYLAYEVRNMGPMKNAGTQWDRLFKTGGAVDIMLGLDPAADLARQAPVAGDKRLLMSMIKDEPVAVLYDAVVPGTPADKRWEAVSPVGRAVFDGVRRIGGFDMVAAPAGSGYVIEVSIPLVELGFTPADGQRVRFDWGIIETDEAGSAVMRRNYWANKATAIIADVPSEARLTPDLWGLALIHESGTRDFANPGKATQDLKDHGGDEEMKKLLNDFDADLEEDGKGKPKK